MSEADFDFSDWQLDPELEALATHPNPELAQAETAIRMLLRDRQWTTMQEGDRSVRVRASDPIDLVHDDWTSAGRVIFAETEDGDFRVVHSIEDLGEVELYTFAWGPQHQDPLVQETIYPLNKDGELGTGKLRSGGRLADRIEEVYHLINLTTAKPTNEGVSNDGQA